MLQEDGAGQLKLAPEAFGGLVGLSSSEAWQLQLPVLSR